MANAENEDQQEFNSTEKIDIYEPPKNGIDKELMDLKKRMEKMEKENKELKSKMSKSPYKPANLNSNPQNLDYPAKEVKPYNVPITTKIPVKQPPKDVNLPLPGTRIINDSEIG